MIHLPHLARAYARVWINPHATTVLAGMLLHSWHPLHSEFEAVPHCFSRRTKVFDAKGYDDSEDDHDDYQRYYDQDAIWRIRFHFWDHYAMGARDTSRPEARKYLSRSNGHLITYLERGNADDPRQYGLVDVIGDPDVIKHDLTLLRIYV